LAFIMIPLGVISILTAFIFVCLYICEKEHVDVIMSLSLSLSYLYFIGYVFQFSYAALACRDRFSAIVEKLNSKIFLNSVDAQNFMEITDKLLKILEHINKFLTFQLIPTFLCFLVFQTFMAYTVVRVVTKYSNLKTLMMILNIFWTLIYTYLMMVASYSAEEVLKSGEALKDKCHEIVCNQNTPKEVGKILKKLKSSLKSSKLQLRTIFFDINWKLVLQSISSSTMFIIITIQFDTSIPSLSVNANSTLF
jgi:hypothetical protein